MTRAKLVEAMARAMRIDADGRDDWADNDDALRRAWLSSATAALAAIEAAGWVCVPREALMEHIKGNNAFCSFVECVNQESEECDCGNTLRSLLAAPPLAQEPGR